MDMEFLLMDWRLEAFGPDQGDDQISAKRQGDGETKQGFDHGRPHKRLRPRA
jgi:hypothetical protein